MVDFHPGYLLNAVFYAAIGVLLFCASFFLAARMIPYDTWKEIVEGKNTALAILIGALMLGLSIIIASAVH